MLNSMPLPVSSQIKFDEHVLHYIALFEKITGVDVIDFIETEDKLIYVVGKSKLAKALGRNSKHLRRLKLKFKKMVDVIEFAPTPEQFIRNIFHNYEITEIKLESSSSRMRRQRQQRQQQPQRQEPSVEAIKVKLKVAPRHKLKLIGKKGKNLKIAHELVQHHYPQIISIKVV